MHNGAKGVGRNFTWTNNHVYSQIDKVLVNVVWVQMWSFFEMVVMEPEFSDHSHLGVSLDDKQNKGAKPFKLFNCLTQHIKFKSLVQREWNGGITTNTLPLV